MRWRLTGLLGCSLLASCAEPDRQHREAPPEARASHDSEPSSSPAPRGERLLGVVLATGVVELRAPFDGMVDQLGVQPGDQVPSGALLAAMSLAPLRNNERMDQALLEQAEAALNRAELESGEATERLQRYLQSPPGALSVDELTSAKYQQRLAATRVATARAQIRERQAALAQVRQHLAEAELRAPFDCVVSARYLDPGARVQAGTPLLRVIQAGGFRVRFALPEDVSARATPGRTVSILLPALGRELPGRVESVSPEVDTPSRMVFAVATLLSTDTTVRAGMVARVSLDSDVTQP
jgi:RND family efflux transporter MFP subunit